ncbi:MAG: transposase [Acidobacteria bacterium]|nr:transposase [Acidobacteriota bacterium]MBU4306545.1 transposase [Acidobacteriota bacterium]MBU4405147.1 transposase [Acidobacteriota bacterium]MCG2810745.1 transposase [Candidatus Aminicenantes bacterium]
MAGKMQGGRGGPPLQKMKKKIEYHGRRSIRLKGWDYSSPNYYFITLCVQNRENLFGNILNGKMMLTAIGSMIEETWLVMQIKYSGITVDEFVIMPNHIHGILGLHVGAGLRACPFASTIESGQEDPGRTRGSAPTGKYLSLSDVIRQFKTLTTKKYSENVIHSHWPEFYKRLWQRNYFEHIIRSEKELEQIRQYIYDNPTNWQNDDENLLRER